MKLPLPRTAGRITRADLLACASLLLPVLLVLRAAILEPGMMLTGHDVSQQYNWEANTRHALEVGQFPFWNPYIFSGFPAFADFQTAVLYPPYLVLRLLPLEQFLLWNTALHLWIAGVGTYLLCRALGVSRPASVMAGIGFGLGGAFTPRLLAGMLHFVCGLAWVPWALLFAIASARRGAIAPHPGLVIVLAAQYLAGYVQIFVYTVAATVFCYCWLRVTHAAGSAIPGRLRGLGMAVLGAATGLAFVVGLISVQLTSTLGLLSEMGRVAGIDYEAAARWAPEPRDALTVLFPRAFASPDRGFQDTTGALLWEKCDYVGLLPSVLALLGLALSWKRTEVRMLTALAVLTFLFALAKSLPFFSLHYMVLGGFRYPGRLLPMFSIAVAVLGAVGLDALVARALDRASERRPWKTGVAVAGAALLGSGCSQDGAFSGRDPGQVLGTPMWIVVISVIGLLAAHLLARLTRTAVISGVLALLVVAVDLVSFGQAFVSVQDPPRFEAVASALADDNVGRVLSACEEGFSLYRPMNVLVPMVDGLNTAFLGSYAQFASLVRDGRVPSSLRQFPTVWLDVPRRLDLLDLMNVTHVVKCTPLNVDRFQLVRQVEGLYIYRNRTALPRAQWMCAADVVESDQQAISLLADARRNVRQRVTLTNPPAEPGDLSLTGCDTRASVDATVQDTPAGSFSARVQSTAPGLLYLSEPYYPERRAWIDGVATSLLRANLAFSAVLVPAGTHRVDLDYSPNRLYVGFAISLITAVVLVLLELRRARSRPGKLFG